MNIQSTKTLADVYYFQLNNHPRKDAFTQKENNKWVSLSSKEFIEKSVKLSLGLIDLGIVKGDRIAVVSNNRIEWHLTDLAIQQIGAVNVPIYSNINPEDYTYILNDCGARVIFISDEEILKKILSVKSSLTSVEYIFTYNQIEGAKNYSELLSNNEDTSEIEELRKTVSEDDLATLIYTSGTTGNPKGVMLTHKNLISNVIASSHRLPMGDDLKALSFLPLCHVFERMLDYLYILKSVSIYYAESIDTIGDDLKDVKPHFFATVPRLLEKVYDKIVAKGTDLTGVKKKLFFWALELGLQFDPNIDKGFWYNFQLNLANKIIFSKWREALGGNIIAVVSGGAALQPRLARVFSSANIPVLEGYGLTETSPVIGVNSLKPGGRMIGTIGKPLENLDVKIAEDGEIIVKGPSIMKGYYNLPDITLEAIDSEGYFHTGDIGEFVGDGFLKITDRKKEIFKTSGGKYIAPQVMENRFKESRFIEQIMVIGEGEKHAAAIIQPDFVFLESWCNRKQIPFENSEKIIENQTVINRIQREVDELNSNFSNYEQIKKFELVPFQWAVDTGELTPTLKLKRKFIKTKFQQLFDKIYRNS
ncbi:long-chain fatty acid--CoA ligase [Vicingus serpentipes]|uniref:Long-chain fatty acid--CoA ligase n=1 Tax=Vicingus serpentipes TaxID=1926625 RepID=A0A5C6RYG6_9FLAO|nr:long-chain fatty acid--CoA ligase [Vicingus serpentipes]TXB66690.1 long-chain fatty acid--CoA ligase [Vicingus serpentipes]